MYGWPDDGLMTTTGCCVRLKQINLLLSFNI